MKKKIFEGKRKSFREFFFYICIKMVLKFLNGFVSGFIIWMKLI